MTISRYATPVVSLPLNELPLNENDLPCPSRAEEQRLTEAAYGTLAHLAYLVDHGLHLCAALAWASLDACEAAGLPLEAAPTVVREAAYRIAASVSADITDPDDMLITPTLLALTQRHPTRIQVDIVCTAAAAVVS